MLRIAKVNWGRIEARERGFISDSHCLHMLKRMYGEEEGKKYFSLLRDYIDKGEIGAVYLRPGDGYRGRLYILKSDVKMFIFYIDNGKF